MRSILGIVAALTLLAATAASAQFVDNGGEAGSADTSAFGQSSEFSNVTTNFDGVDLQIQRLIRDPKDKSKLRLIGQIVNTNTDNRWIFLFSPFPKLTDELGNVYNTYMWTGVDACRKGDKENYNWQDETGGCPDDGVSTLLGPNLPVTFSIVFGPSEEATFDSDLAALATYLNATLSFVLSPADPVFIDDYDARSTQIKQYSVVIPKMPVPSQ